MTGENSPKALAQKLQQTKLVVSDSKTCSRLPFFDEKKMICAIDPVSSRNSNACNGKIFTFNKYFCCFKQLVNTIKAIVVGITSMIIINIANRFCDPAQPSYYTNVSFFVEWIKNSISNSL